MNTHIQGVICLCGNDGTGKSTLAKIIPSLFPQLHAIERSFPQTSPSFESLRKEIKHIDRLTYRYSFESQREEFEPSSSVLTQEGVTLPVYWIMLHLQPPVIFQRIAEREEMGIYESKKCVEYYSFVYLELAAYYGMTVVDVNGTAQENATKIAQIIISGAGEQIKKVNLKKLTLSTINSLNVESQIISQLSQDLVKRIIFEKWLKDIQEDLPLHDFYFPELPKIIGDQGQIDWKLCYLIAARWIITNHTINKNGSGELFINVNVEDLSIEILLSSPSFLYFTEGESKLIFQIISKNQHVLAHFKSKIWILLKSTIYSHTKQHTGEIQNLGKIRAVGSTLFLEMLRRNNLKHAYVAINKDGIIYSNKIQINNVEIVFKKEFVGTDKHSYFMMEEHRDIVASDNRYKSGIYVRFDWRNPNHYLKKYPKHILNLHPFYYIIEKVLGKEHFFDVFLSSGKIVPLGDKCISQDVISKYMHTGKVKKAVLSLYCAFSYYCKRVGLEIIDGCFMLDSQGDTVWSEINPDCMRVKKNELDSTRVNYDKDIWRIGGSASKAQILEKWTLFNKLFIDYFTNNRFHQTELLQTTPLFYPQSQEALRLLKEHSGSLTQQYRQALKEIAHCTQKQKEIIATIDISEGKPTLVKSSELSEHHSENSLEHAHRYINVLPKIVLVDLDSALGKQTNNQKEIKSLCTKSYSNVYGVGGGIRSKEVLSYYLYQLLVPKVIISTNLELLKDLSKEEISSRIIVQLSINEQNEVLTHGRKVNTHQNVIKKMIELSKIGVRVVSLTFNQKEGQLSGIPCEQFRDIMFTVPGSIKKVIIAGGITSLRDLQYIWGFPKAVPQLGSAIWKNKISIEDIYHQIINFNSEGLCPAIITDTSEKLLGQVFMNQQAISKTIQTRQVYRFSRKLGRLIKKGEQSGNTQKVVAFRLDCDNDCLNIIVQESIKPFCHQQCQSCFDFECLHKTQNMISLQNHLLRKKETGTGYSKRMQQNEHLALSKFIEESYEFSLTKTRIVEEGADVISHMLMYLNAKGIPFQSIMKELEVRSTQVKPKKSILSNEEKKCVYMGVMGGKHYEKIDKAMLNCLGIRVIRPTNRSLKISHAIEDEQKYNQFFKGMHLSLIGIKSKDMQQLLNKQYISFCFNYSIMMENTPKVWVEHFKEPISQIKLVLLERNCEKKVDPYSWTPNSKGRIASEYPRSVVNYFQEIGVDESCYSIIQVSGGTESYLQIDSFDYCDAIAESGRTIEDNNLRIVKVLAPQIQAAMYTLVE